MGSRLVRAAFRRGTARVASATALLAWLALAAPGLTRAAAAAPTPLPCTEAGLDSAGTSGGTYTFQCSNMAIQITAPVVVSATNLTIDGTGQGVTIRPITTCTYPTCGIRLFTVQPSANFDLTGVTLSHGLTLGTPGVAGTDGDIGQAGTDGTNATTGGDGTGGMGGAMNIASGAIVTLDNVTFFGDLAIGANGGSGGSGGNSTGGTTGTPGTSASGCGSGTTGGTGTSGGDAGAAGNGGSGSLAQGGAIFNAGQLTITSSDFASDKAEGGGGGEAGSGGNGNGGGEGGMGGAASCMGNTSGSGGGGGDGGNGANGGNGGDAGSGQGGAIYNTGSLTVSGTTFSGNQAGGGFDAGGAGSGGLAGSPGAGGGPGDASAGATAGAKGADGSYGATGDPGTAGKGGDAQGGAIYSSGATNLQSDGFENNVAISTGGGGGGDGGATQDGNDGGAGGDAGAAQGGAVFGTGPIGLTINQSNFQHDSSTGGMGGNGGTGGDALSFPAAGTGGNGGAAGAAGIAYGGGVFIDTGVTAQVTGASFIDEGALGGPGGVGGSGGAGNTVDPNTPGTGGDGADGGTGGSGFGGALFNNGTISGVFSASCESNAAGGGAGGFAGLAGAGFNISDDNVNPGTDGSNGMVGLGVDNDTDPAMTCGQIGGQFFALSPQRILDTRTTLGGAHGPVASGATVHLLVDGAGGVPASNVAAVVLNVTVTQPTRGGFLTVFPDGTTRPVVSNLNFTAGETIPNLVVAPVGAADGKVDIYNGSSGTVQVIADVSGYFNKGAAGPGSLSPLTPSRILDTRSGKGAVGPVASHATVRLTVDHTGGVPTDNVAAVVLNVTATQPTASGFLTVYPDGSTTPTVSNLNFRAGETIPNLVIAPVGADGKVAIYNGSSGTVQILADVSGYFEAGAAGPGGFSTVGPTRILDTRSGIGSSGPVASHAVVALVVEGAGGVPSTGVAAAVLNVTVTQPAGAGFLTVYPDHATRPVVSNLNFTGGETIPNLVIARVGTNHGVDIYNGSPGTVQIIADVSGYFLTG